MGQCVQEYLSVLRYRPLQYSYKAWRRFIVAETPHGRHRKGLCTRFVDRRRNFYYICDVCTYKLIKAIILLRFNLVFIFIFIVIILSISDISNTLQFSWSRTIAVFLVDIWILCPSILFSNQPTTIFLKKILLDFLFSFSFKASESCYNYVSDSENRFIKNHKITFLKVSSIELSLITKIKTVFERSVEQKSWRISDLVKN